MGFQGWLAFDQQFILQGVVSIHLAGCFHKRLTKQSQHITFTFFLLRRFARQVLLVDPAGYSVRTDELQGAECLPNCRVPHEALV